MRFAVIPAFNEEQTIGHVILSLSPYVDKIVVVNDSSSDDTDTISTQLGALVITNHENKGYDYSLLRGIKYSISNGASSIVTFDADGQHPFEVLDEMFDLIEGKRCDIVLGDRGSLPRFSEILLSLYTKFKYNIPDILCGLKCYSVRVLCHQSLDCGWDSVGSYPTLMSVKYGYKCISIPISSPPRLSGLSRYGQSLIAEKKILYAFFRSLFI